MPLNNFVEIKTVKIIYEILGFIGVALNVGVYQQKKRKRLLVIKLISDVVWTVYYGVRGNYSGAAVAAIGIARESTFLSIEDKKTDRRPFLLLFLACACVSVYCTWGGWFSVLPATASFLSVVSFWQQKPRVSRLLTIPISACMLTYSLAVGSMPGIANEVFTLSSTFVGIIRHDIKRNRE